jgi:hypothetical protein
MINVQYTDEETEAEESLGYFQLGNTDLLPVIIAK